MSQVQPSGFVRSYAALLKQTWSGDEEFRRKLLAEPEKVVREFGLDPAEAKVHIITDIQAEGSLDDQIRLWEEGKVSGNINLYVPLETPEGASPEDEVELSDEMLEMVSGGGCTCCSCPCSCCCC